MKKVWKFGLQLTEKQTVEMPNGSRILMVAVQHGVICVWAEVDPLEPPIRVDFTLVGTGYSTPNDWSTHVGSVLMGDFVWHVYMKLPRQSKVLPS